MVSLFTTTQRIVLSCIKGGGTIKPFLSHLSTSRRNVFTMWRLPSPPYITFVFSYYHFYFPPPLSQYHTANNIKYTQPLVASRSLYNFSDARSPCHALLGNTTYPVEGVFATSSSGCRPRGRPPCLRRGLVFASGRFAQPRGWIVSRRFGFSRPNCTSSAAMITITPRPQHCICPACSTRGHSWTVAYGMVERWR